MTDRSSSYGQADEWSRYRSGAADQQQSGQGGPGQQYYGQGMADSGLGGPAAAPARGTAKERSFLAALFDFSFTSFISTRVIKVLYVLVVIMTGLSVLVFTFVAFKANATLGLLTLVIADPLFIIIVLALWRLLLEACIVFFRIGEDVQTLRERGEIR